MDEKKVETQTFNFKTRIQANFNNGKKSETRLRIISDLTVTRPDEADIYLHLIQNLQI